MANIIYNGENSKNLFSKIWYKARMPLFMNTQEKLHKLNFQGQKRNRIKHKNVNSE